MAKEDKRVVLMEEGRKGKESKMEAHQKASTFSLVDN
jgi:hypothetical protein